MGLELAGRPHARVVDHQVERTEALSGQGEEALRGRQSSVRSAATVIIRAGSAPSPRRVLRRRDSRRSADRPVRMTACPARTRCSAKALPSPDEAPVTRARVLFHDLGFRMSGLLLDRRILVGPFHLCHGGRSVGIGHSPAEPRLAFSRLADDDTRLTAVADRGGSRYARADGPISCHVAERTGRHCAGHDGARRAAGLVPVVVIVLVAAPAAASQPAGQDGARRVRQANRSSGCFAWRISCVATRPCRMLAGGSITTPPGPNNVKTRTHHPVTINGRRKSIPVTDRSIARSKREASSKR